MTFLFGVAVSVSYLQQANSAKRHNIKRLRNSDD